MLLGARHEAERASLGFALVLPQRDYTQVHRILDLTGLVSAFATYTRLDDALAAARAGVVVGEPIKAA